jgi:AraC-like DNA-binding protein
MDSGHFISILLHKNPYAEFITGGIQQEGGILSSMGYPLLKLISLMHTRTPGSHKERWVPAYIRLLFAELRREPLKKSSFRFTELKTVFDAVEELQTTSSDFPAASELIVKTGIPKFRFEKSCQALYGQPIKKIIQHLKMKRGFEELVNRGKNVMFTHTELGYDHSENFTTAFHKHFGITPLQAVKFHRS